MAKMPPDSRTPYRGYACNIGLAFEIADDLIDSTGDEAAAGKPIRRDADAGKATSASALGEERARQQAGLLVDQAIEHLSDHGSEAVLLRAIARFAIERDHEAGARMTCCLSGYIRPADPRPPRHRPPWRAPCRQAGDGVTTNPSKEPMFSVQECLAMVKREVQGIGGSIDVVEFDSLLMDFAEARGRL